MADIFISYSSEDKTIVKQVAGLLEARGWSVWWDRQIPVGQKYDTVIENELKLAGCVVVIWTQRSVQSEWVKNEALEAAQNNKLVPVMLEMVTLPLAFKRIEAAMLIGWNGEDEHPELENFYSSVTNVLQQKNNTGTTNTVSNTIKQPTNTHAPVYPDLIIAVAGLVSSVLLFYYFLQQVKPNTGETNRTILYVILLLAGIALGGFVYGLINYYAILKTGRRNIKYPIRAGLVAGLAVILMGALSIPSKPAERTVTVRIFDWKKNPVTQGDVKIYLKEYIRTQSIDNMGQALFTGIPADMANNKIQVEVSSPGYATRHFDTLLNSSKPLELILPLTTVVLISGKIKTAAEIPIRGVEVNVDGTRYYAISITDGTYNLRLEEYTLGDEITITTSHKDFEDKTISLKINSPEIKNEDIFLNPVHH